MFLFGGIEIKKTNIFLITLSVLLLFLYWLKIQLQINIFQSFSVSSYFPFSYLADKKILSPKKGIIFQDDFENWRIFKTWSKHNLNKSAIVSREMSADDNNNTRCLVIRNTGDTTWVYPYNRFIETSAGDVFYYEGIVNMKGNKLVTYFNIAAYDADEKIINWSLYKKSTNQTGCWTKIQKTFSISDRRIKFIVFRLVGKGSGEFRYDNILFKKIGAASVK